MHDQANQLRGLMEHRSRSRVDSVASGDCRTVAVTSGKGGVGKSNVALNLAIALAEAGKSVLLLDVNFGVGSLELLCGLNSPWNLSHVLSGGMSIEEILVEGPAGVMILPGAGSLGEGNHDPSSLEVVFQQLANLKRQFQFTILDLGTGLHRLLERLVAPADLAIMLTTTEPPSLAEAYVAIKSLSSLQAIAWEILINQADSATEAESIFQRLSHTTRAFLQRELALAGWIPSDPHVPKAVRSRSPFLIDSPHTAASQSIKQLTRNLLDPVTDAHAISQLSHITHRAPWAAFEASARVAAR